MSFPMKMKNNISKTISLKTPPYQDKDNLDHTDARINIKKSCLLEIVLCIVLFILLWCEFKSVERNS